MLFVIEENQNRHTNGNDTILQMMKTVILKYMKKYLAMDSHFY